MKSLTFVQHGAREGQDAWPNVLTPPFSTLSIDSLGNPRIHPYWTARSVFNLLPAASATAGKDDLTLSLGTGTEVIARATKAGINVKTQASTPADNDNAMIIAAVSSGMLAPLTAVSQPRLVTRVNLTQITELVFGAGLDENQTSPVSSATAGDGAGFYFDPAGEVTTGGAVGNWICTQKVAGADTYIDSLVPVQAGRDYNLDVKYGPDLKPLYYIDGILVATSTVAGTSAAVIGAMVGVQINAGSPAGQKDFDIRYLSVERFFG